MKRRFPKWPKWPRKERERTMKRTCAICGKQLIILVAGNKTYSGGHFFGKMNLGNEQAEYWECDDCFVEWPKGVEG